MTPLEKLIEALEVGGQTKYSLHFIKKIANKLIEEEKYCNCRSRMDQYFLGKDYICCDCEKIIKNKK